VIHPAGKLSVEVSGRQILDGNTANNVGVLILEAACFSLRNLSNAIWGGIMAKGGPKPGGMI
jgi:hypothetical protein